MSDGGVLTANGANVSVLWNKIGLFSLSVATPDGCLKAIQVNVKENPKSITGFVGDTMVCVGSSNYQVDFVSDNSYIWKLSSGGNITPLFNTATILWSIAGIHTLTVFPSNICGNGESFIKNITVLGLPLISTTIFGTDIACINSNIEYQTPLIPNQTNQWNVGTSGILTENKEKANVIWKKTGAQVINLKAINLCGTSPNLVKIVNVSSIPSDFVITGDTTVCLGLERYSIQNSENGVNYQWNLNNGGLISATGSNCSINWTTTGVHILTVSSINFCGNGIVQILKVSVRTVPESVSQIFGDTVACRGISNYSVNNTTSNFNWSISGGGFISPLANSANVNWTQIGKFRLTCILWGLDYLCRKKKMLEMAYLSNYFPLGLLEHFTIKGFIELGNIEEKTMFYEIQLEENNVILGGLEQSLYESKGFTDVVLQDFPVRGKAVFLRIKRRRWRLKTDKSKIHRNDFTFVAAGSGFTQELSDFLKDSGRYTCRYDYEYR